MKKREIKFRVWDASARTWLEETQFILHCSGNLIRVPEHLILMQSTGLVDKHGREGYEGDLVQFFPYGLPFVITWNENDACFQMERASGSHKGLICSMNLLHLAEIVGNIYEHPELLKDSKE